MKSKSTEPSSPARAFQYALRLLAARDYTRAALEKKLVARDFSGVDAESAIVRLEAEGWLDDRRFAERFAEAAIIGNRFAGQRLRMELRRRGVPADIANDVLGRLREEHDEHAAVRSLVKQRFPEFSLINASDKEKRRVFGFLQRRGFSFSVIMGAFRADE